MSQRIKIMEHVMSHSYPRTLTESESAVVDVAGFMAEMGKRVIHPGGRPSTESLLRLAELESNHHVLDVGCGVGTTGIRMATRVGCRVTAVDIEPRMVDRARRNVARANLSDRVTIEQGDILSLAFADDTFDRVMVEAVTMFVDRPRALQEMVRVCKPGGFVLDHEVCRQGTLPKDVRDVMLRDLFPGMELSDMSQWMHLLESAGLQDIRREEFPVALASPKAMIRDEGFNALRILGRALASPTRFKRLRTVLGPMRIIQPYFTAFVLRGTKPNT